MTLAIIRQVQVAVATFLPEIITVKGFSLCAEVMNLQYSNLISLAVVFCHPESTVSHQKLRAAARVLNLLGKK